MFAWKYQAIPAKKYFGFVVDEFSKRECDYRGTVSKPCRSIAGHAGFGEIGLTQSELR